MSTWWEKAEGKCKFCSAMVAAVKVDKGKIKIAERTKNWGTLVKVPGKSQMYAVCRACQKEGK